MEQVAALLAHGGQIGACDAEVVSTLRGAKASGDLLFEFGHPSVALGLVVVERNPRIVEEAQYIVGVSPQACEEIGRGRLLDAPASAGFARVDRPRSGRCPASPTAAAHGPASGAAVT